MKIGDAGYLDIAKKPSFSEPKTNEEKELKSAAQSFESIFIKMMLDAMDKTAENKDSMFSGGEGEDTFKGMLNEERAKNISKGSGIGLAKIIYEQLAKHVDKGE